MKFLIHSISGAAIAVLLASSLAYAAQDQMPGMPQAHSKSSYTVKSVDQGQTLQDARGFGDQAPMIRMMNLMMVGGSGYEGMAMTPSHAQAGGQAMSDMPGMAMDGNGSSKPTQENQSMSAMPGMAGMPGMAMDGAQGKGTQASPQKTDAAYDYQLKGPAGGAKVGANQIVIAIHQIKNHQPAKGLKLKAQVYMTSMDMGLGKPRVKEIAPGEYQLKAIFAMEGPWAVKIILPGGHEQVFNFSVK